MTTSPPIAPPPHEGPPPTNPILRIVFAVLAAAALAAGILFLLAPGTADLPDHRVAGTEGPDDGYWTAPLRRLAGTGDQDRFDHDLALSLALPENGLGALAWRCGVPADLARFAGTAFGLFGLLLAAFLLRGAVAVVATALLLVSPPILGHLRTDLGEGTAFGLVALFGLALLRGRIGIAAFVAGLAIFQKAAGLPLGVGVLAAVFAGPGAGCRFRRATLGALLGVGAATAVAALVFGDDPLRFVLRPFVATQDTAGGWIDPKSFLLQAAFPAAYGVGSHLVLLFAAGAVLALRARPNGPVLVAFLSGLGFAGLFPDPWRVLPSLALLPGLLATPRADTDSRAARLAGYLLAVVLVVEAAVALAVRFAPDLVRPRLLLAAAGGALPVVAFLRWRRPSVKTAGILVGVLAAAAAVLQGGDLARVVRPGTARRELAARVTGMLPAQAHLIGYSFLSTSFRGTLFYPPFASRWAPELANGPPALHRILPFETSMAAEPIAGYEKTEARLLGVAPWGRRADPRELVLETWTRR